MIYLWFMMYACWFMRKAIWLITLLVQYMTVKPQRNFSTKLNFNIQEGKLIWKERKINGVYQLYLKVNFWNVVVKAKFRNFSILCKHHVPFKGYLNICTWGRVHFWISLLNHTSFGLMKKIAWFGELSPKARSFLIYQPTTINQNSKLTDWIILPFNQNHKRTWNSFSVFTIELTL